MNLIEKVNGEYERKELERIIKEAEESLKAHDKRMARQQSYYEWSCKVIFCLCIIRIILLIIKGA